ncbi:hypothetical protein BJ875DRAFT_436307 [Amylocarpus encephaloides]|uniref:Postreplication repair E3 ubiquitin-protein ligase RAD18 n=1 Tax=Amylocarpus encephaloides TaxID=45428 RepID=A0A9P8CBT7_9HELO|nr:hypothetical protein BJ875DRAFT_436307 [Amylocarpus encephaloides]
MPPKRKTPCVAGEAETTDWNELTIAELKVELQSRNLPISGNKTTLVERMNNADMQAEAMEAPQQDWNVLTIAQLKVELGNRGHPISGNKTTLIERMNNADTQAEAMEAPQQDWNALTIAQLKVELGNRGLPISGNKTTLIGRLDESTGRDTSAPAPKRLRATAPQEASASNDTASIASGERRLRPFVEEPDEAYKKKLKKIKTERLFMLDRQKSVDKDGYICEKFEIAGSTGNVYKTTIGRSPNCVCMDARMRGQKCKHINYALIIILKAPPNLCYQQAFLSTEIESIFANAPVTRAPEPEHDHDHVEDESMYAGKRKAVEAECPICVFDMEEGEELVWCKAACGQNFHKDCFDQWKRSKNGGTVTCVYCRTPWQDDLPAGAAPGSLAALKHMAPKIGSYQNVSHLLPHQQGHHEVDLEGYE